MTPRTSRVLVTGFEPFDADSLNSSASIVAAIAGDENVVAKVLPVDHIRAGESLRQSIEFEAPEAVICLGQAFDRHEITPEKVAINLCAFRIPDNAGNQPLDEPVVDGGPAAHFSTLPINEIVGAISERNTPARVSLTAGAYVCNALFYDLMHYLETQGLQIPAGFIHVPPLPEQDYACEMALDDQVAAIREAIRVTRSAPRRSLLRSSVAAPLP
jgi:pyroglutamyl-peptidase